MQRTAASSSADGQRGARALFLDRDGVINHDSGYPYLPGHIVFTDGIFDVCRLAMDKGYLIVVVTNQAGVAKGIFSEDDVQSLHSWMRVEFQKRGVNIAGFYYCPYHEKAIHDRYRGNAHLRKPEPGMFLQAATDLGIDLSRSLMVGDKPSDRIRHPELKCIIIKSRYTGEDYDIESIAALPAML